MWPHAISVGVTSADFFVQPAGPRRCGVIGAGGHAKVVVSALQSAGFEVVGCFDDDPALSGRSVCGAPVLGGLADASASGLALIIAVGANTARERLARRFEGSGWITAVHARALYEAAAPPGPGTLVALGAMVQVDARIGAHVILNTGSIVEHDCRIGDFVHIGPGAALGGGVVVEDGAFVGLGARILPRVRIGAGAVIGAGATVVRDVPPGATQAGTPARELRPQ